MNNKESFISIPCSKSKLKDWRENKGVTKKTYTKFYPVNTFQEISWLFFITFFGIFGQLIFRFYFFKKCYVQWWWLLFYPYLWMPFLSVLPALFLSGNMFWIRRFEDYYESSIKNNKNIPFIIKLFFILIIRLVKPEFIPGAI